MTWSSATEYLCHIWQRICSVCCNHNLVLSSFMTYHQICDKGSTTDVTSLEGTAYHSGGNLLFMGFALINPCGVLWIFGCPFVLFLLVIALSFLNILLVIKRWYIITYVHITVDIDGVMISMLALSMSGTGQDKQKTITLVFAVSPLSTWFLKWNNGNDNLANDEYH